MLLQRWFDYSLSAESALTYFSPLLEILGEGLTGTDHFYTL